MYANLCYIKVSRIGPIQSNKCASSSTWQSISRSGIALQIPMGYYGWIASRSGLAIHHHIHVGAGVVDPDYIGSIHVLLMNFSSQDHVIEKNHRIAQMILEKVAYPVICEVSQTLPTERGAKGFGSTGK